VERAAGTRRARTQREPWPTRLRKRRTFAQRLPGDSESDGGIDREDASADDQMDEDERAGLDGARPRRLRVTWTADADEQLVAAIVVLSTSSKLYRAARQIPWDLVTEALFPDRPIGTPALSLASEQARGPVDARAHCRSAELGVCGGRADAVRRRFQVLRKLPQWSTLLAAQQRHRAQLWQATYGGAGAPAAPADSDDAAAVKRTVRTPDELRDEVAKWRAFVQYAATGCATCACLGKTHLATVEPRLRNAVGTGVIRPQSLPRAPPTPRCRWTWTRYTARTRSLRSARRRPLRPIRSERRARAPRGRRRRVRPSWRCLCSKTRWQCPWHRPGRLPSWPHRSARPAAPAPSQRIPCGRSWRSSRCARAVGPRSFLVASRSCHRGAVVLQGAHGQAVLGHGALAENEATAARTRLQAVEAAVLQEAVERLLTADLIQRKAAKPAPTESPAGTAGDTVPPAPPAAPDADAAAAYELADRCVPLAYACRRWPGRLPSAPPMPRRDASLRGQRAAVAAERGGLGAAGPRPSALSGRVTPEHRRGR